MCDRRNGREKNAAAAAAEFRDRARFYAIRQVYGERAYDWYRRLRAAAVPCGFDAGRRAATVADKFVTGLRPGPVADRLLGERADGRLEDLLAAAVAAEEEQEAKEELEAADGATAPVVSRTTRAEDVIAEIREGLKLYRYSGGDGDAVRSPFGPSTTSDGRSRRRTDHAATGRDGNVTDDRYPPLTCASCCGLATKLLESFGDDGDDDGDGPAGKNSVVDWSSEDVGRGDDRRSECYCCSPYADHGR